MTKPMLIEKLKNILLVVLLLSTILLLYFFWGNLSFEKLGMQEPQIEQEVPSVREVLRPYRMIINFGSENYTVVTTEKPYLWDGAENIGFIYELKKFSQTENLLVEEITYSQYQEIMNYKSSIRAEFQYNIPFTDFCSEYEIKKNQSYNAIETLTTVGYSEGSPESIFLYDGKNSKYYRIVADSDQTTFTALISTVEQEGYLNYYPISVYLGIENHTLVLPELQANLKSFSYQQEAYAHQVDKINEMAESFFGENFDFVRKIKEDNGTIIYMYGYGQNVLIVNNDGSFVYKEDEPDRVSSQQSYFDSLKTALQYVASHGSWGSLDGAVMKPYLKNIRINPEGKKGYRFIFGMEINGTRLYYEQGEIITVDVIQGQVTYYNRNMIHFDQEEVNTLQAASFEDTATAGNTIAQNYQYIYGILINTKNITEPVDQSRIFEEVAGLITNIQTGYVKTLNSSQDFEVSPAWIVSINRINIYFDLYSAEPLGYSEE